MKKLFDKIIYPVIAIVLANIIIVVGGKLEYGNWTSLYSEIPFWLLILVFGLLVIWLLAVLYFRRIKNLNKEPDLPFMIVDTPGYGYSDIGILVYRGVKWKIIHPNDRPNSISLGIKLDSIKVKPDPLCPNCTEMELSESRNIFGRYVWKCLGCGLIKWSKKSAFKMSKTDILKIAKSKTATELQK